MAFMQFKDSKVLSENFFPNVLTSSNFVYQIYEISSSSFSSPFKRTIFAGGIALSSV